MPAAATVIVTSRDRWDHAGATLDRLLERTDDRHRIVVVDGAAPPDVATEFDRVRASGRIEVVRSERFLATNEGRRLALDRGVDTDWVAFVENDAVPSDGWLDTLIERADAAGVASTFPVYLEDTQWGRVVHGSGADLEISSTPTGRRLREVSPYCFELWSEVRDLLIEAPRHQAEPHCLVVRSDFLESTGAPDPELLGWFEHLEMALHHLDAGAECRLVPEVTCLYLAPTRLRPRELPTFLLRWGRGWYEHSRRRMCDRWDIDPADPGWDVHEHFRTTVRRSALGGARRPAPRPARIVGRTLDTAIVPLERRIERRWFAERSPAVVAPA